MHAHEHILSYAPIRIRRQDSISHGRSHVHAKIRQRRGAGERGVPAACSVSVRPVASVLLTLRRCIASSTAVESIGRERSPLFVSSSLTIPSVKPQLMGQQRPEKGQPWSYQPAGPACREQANGSRAGWRSKLPQCVGWNQLPQRAGWNQLPQRAGWNQLPHSMKRELVVARSSVSATEGARAMSTTGRRTAG